MDSTPCETGRRGLGRPPCRRGPRLGEASQYLQVDVGIVVGVVARDDAGSMPEQGVSTSREIRVTRTPRIGIMPDRLSTATWM
jgi:hypothetical protein